MSQTPTPMTVADFVAILLEGRDLDTVILERFAASDKERPDQSELYRVVFTQRGHEAMFYAVEAAGLHWGSTYKARYDAQHLILDRAAELSREVHQAEATRPGTLGED